MGLVLTIRQELRQTLDTTPGLISAWMLGIIATAVLFLLAVCSGVRQYRDALKAVCVDSAPSIVAAQDIKARLADLDANAANELIGSVEQGAAARKGYDEDRMALSVDLVKAAKNITYGDAEEVPIRSIEYGLGQFEMHVARARLLDERSDPQRQQEYLAATAIMHDSLLKYAEQLDAANRKVLEDTYKSAGSREIVANAFILLTAALLLGSLAALQFLLPQRTRRILNAGLVASTIVTVVFLIFVISSLAGSKEDLRAAKADCFDSISALSRTRAVAMDANGAESRWLLAKATGHTGNEYEVEFRQKIRLIAAVPDGQSYDTIASASHRAGKASAGWSGYLADELNNITFNGELDAATTALSRWGTYVVLDGKIRQLENSGNHAEAVTLCCGTKPGQSDWAFSEFDTALQKVIDINQKALDATYARGVERLSWFEEFATFVCILVCVLAFLGIRPRLREYAI
ncbi:MAG: hypothetical protein ACYCW6_14620 [Candidatus Xenobia bacterium]